MKTCSVLFILLITIASLGCSNQNKSNDRIQNLALEKGKFIADSTQKVLAGNLKMAIGEDGLKNAISFCNLKAMPLTNEMEQMFGADIKRTTFKVRNSANAPTEVESEILSKYDSVHSAGGKPKPAAKWLDQQTLLYTQPIMIGNGLCLNCHGKVGEVVPDSFYAFVKKKYPEDKAIGYEMGDLRGMWSITFNKTSLEEDSNH